MADDERTPTAWELLRAVQAVGQGVAEVRETMLTKDRFDEYQRGTDRRFEASERRQAEWEAKSERAHGELDGKIDAAAAKAAAEAKAVASAAASKAEAIEKALEQREEKARDSRGRVWIGIGLTALAVILPRVWELMRGTGVTP